MTAPKAAARKSRLARAVLTDSAGHGAAKDAAWDLLDAIRELFPDRICELEWRLPDDLDLHEQSDRDELDRRVEDWAIRNHIACPVVIETATDLALGFSGRPPRYVIYGDRNALGGRLQLPSITADPPHETVEEFLKRAEAHYEQLRELFLKRGYKPAPVKRELDHFRYLAAHLVGGYSFAKIAAGEVPELPNLGAHRQASTIASESRNAAALIGLNLPAKPGPRPGSKMPRSRRRPRRA